ncbi:hypothetical protein B0H10DRAFT_2207954 [Mycena sp. CBHHK59/15]|nr:hypothetical protein B0H10DRAFT_2207954 [Mycena sp. CBHHK59/15]
MTTNECIPATALAAPAHALGDTDTPSITHEARYSLEWSWALEYGTLDAYLGGFTDSHTHVLRDDNLLLVPHPDIVRKAWVRTCLADPKVPNEPIENMYAGSTSFDYAVLPVDPSNPIPLRRWRELIGSDFNAVLRSLVALAEASDFAESTLMPVLRTFNHIIFIQQTWTCGAYVPPSFRGLKKETSSPESKDKGYTYILSRSVASSVHEPQRRLLPCEGGAPDPDVPQIRMFPDANTADSDDDGDTISWDSHIPGADEPEEYAKASIARGDYAADGKWLKRMSNWVEGTSGSDDEQQLVNDAQIEVDLKEQPRPATSLDLNKPDYLPVTRTHKKRRM